MIEAAQARLRDWLGANAAPPGQIKLTADAAQTLIEVSEDGAYECWTRVAGNPNRFIALVCGQA
jgi:hypothetical protein